MTPLERHILENATAFARERMARLHSSHGWDHVERVAHMAELIAATEPSADLFIVCASVILHDIARIDEAESGGTVCHAELGSVLAHEHLTAGGLDPERAGLIRDSILTHRYRNDRVPSCIEAQILYDADKLDSIGAVGIGRAFLF
ncbi:MAG: HD domain-containing protein, partial [Chrysiogenales bacterium]